MALTAGTSFTFKGAADMIDTPHVSAIHVNRQMVAERFAVRLRAIENSEL
jgi:hypothetical protein